MPTTISRSKLSRYSSLQQKKYRRLYKEFVVEGIKGVEEFIRSGFDIIDLIVEEGNAEVSFYPVDQILWISEKDMKKISSLITAPGIVGVFALPAEKIDESWKDSFSLVLDGVRDPGNMGTIIRTADWFGIKNIFCSEDCVDIYNTKVVQSSMGSLARVNVVYVDISAMFKSLPADFFLLGAYMDGESIANFQFTGKGALVMGNESEGIRAGMSTLISKKICIPRAANSNTESLNVSIAAAILCYSLTR
ncbi:MAG: RNA methyltransferase [Bacteroidetes bacterium]|nr:RNA methyltransferase [Bacteroidota bacterium]